MAHQMAHQTVYRTVNDIDPPAFSQPPYSARPFFVIYPALPPPYTQEEP